MPYKLAEISTLLYDNRISDRIFVEIVAEAYAAEMVTKREAVSFILKRGLIRLYAELKKNSNRNKNNEYSKRSETAQN